MKILTIALSLISLTSLAQQQTADSLRTNYLSKQKTTSNEFANYFYPSRNIIYALPEKQFVFKMDSLRNRFQKVLNTYKVESRNSDVTFNKEQETDIHFFFDKIILDYPYFHEIFTGKNVSLSAPIQKRLDRNLSDFNNKDLLASDDFKEYIRGFLRHKSSIELKKPFYKKMDNQRLNSFLNLIPKYFTNRACMDFWQYDYLYKHIDDWGVKNLATVVYKFESSCKNIAYRTTIDSFYRDGMKGRENHLIKTYKTVDGFNLDIHLFLPDSLDKSRKNPVMVFFSGGSWTKGNPEWAFYSCADYAKKGWVGVSVEYRLADRQGTTPFEAVKDARTAIRWLRENASQYNIDTSRIVASGNSAGGHLVLSTALANDWNESTDNLNYSASPNLLIVHAAVYNLGADGNTDWVTKDRKDKNMVKKISPLHLVRKKLPPMLIIHGTNDQAVPYATAAVFANELKKLGNDFEFHTLQGAPHHIWFDRRFSGKVSTLRKEFLKKYGYE